MSGNINLTDQQRSAISMVQENNISALIGGPGTGKTTTIKSIISWFQEKNMRVLLAAPTGKAAKRMMEATGCFASTIHSMLGCEMGKNGEFHFIHNESKHLRADLIILDEISMLSIDMIDNVLKAVAPTKTKILFVGDQNQLPSVGPGAVLRDIIDSGVVPVVELDVIHRNTGLIVSACHQIKLGKTYSPHRHLDFTKENPINLIHVECVNNQDILHAIEHLVTKILPGKCIPGKPDGFNPLEDIQVLSPVNTSGDLSCYSINQVLRRVLNPPDDLQLQEEKEMETDYKVRKKKNSKAMPKLPFRVGDKIIQTKNEQISGEIVIYDPKTGEPVSRKVQPVNIVNGDIGTVVEMSHDKKNLSCYFPDPGRLVVIPRKANNLLHAYCITCHKFQGSEAPAIIIPMTPSYSFHTYNSWLYTAISRAKLVCITVGKFSAVEKAILNIKPNDRKTKLKERILAARKESMMNMFGDL